MRYTLFDVVEHWEEGGVELDALRAFIRVAELSSFTRAAEQLGLTKSALSARISGLERALGAQLLLRTTRTVRLTEDGAQLLPHARGLLASAEEVQSLFSPARGGLRGRIRLDLPVRLARELVIPRLPGLLEAHPQLELLVSSTDRPVDLVREGFDLVLRVGALADSGLTVRRLGSLRMINCASPGYLARHGTPGTPAELSRHYVVNYSPTLHPGEATFDWQEGGALRSVPVRWLVSVNSTDAYEAACHAGLGIIQAPRTGKEQDLAEGRLVEILPGHLYPPMPVSLLHGARTPRGLPRRVRTVMSWLEGLLAPHLGKAG